MTYQPWMPFAFALFQFIFNAAIAFSVWWKNRDKVVNARFKAVEDRLGDIEKKLDRVEEMAKHPMVCGSHSRMEDTDRHVNDALDVMGKLLAKIDGRLDGLNRMVDLLTQNELRGEKG